MFMIATIQTKVMGTPSQAGKLLDADEREREAVDRDPEADRDRRGELWPPSFAHQGRPRKSSTTPTQVAIAAPSRIPR